MTDGRGRSLTRRTSTLAMLGRPRALWRFLRDPKAPGLPRLLALLALAYVILPLDAIPDLAPVLGWLDDMGVAGAVTAYVAAQAARHNDGRESSGGVSPPG